MQRNMNTFFLVLLVFNLIQASFALFKLRGVQSLSRNGGKKDHNSFEKTPLKSRIQTKGPYYVQLSSVGRPSVLRPDSSVTLHCKLRGKQRPFATFLWEKNGLPLIASSRRRIRTRLRSERLRIKRVTAGDAGKYRCIAVIDGRKWYSSAEKIFFKGNLSRSNGFQQRSGTHSQEKCEPYRGSVCVDNLNSKGDVFMRSNENQNEIEELLRDNMKHVAKLISPECYPAVLRVVCVSLFPPCRLVNGSATPMRICKESCAQIRRSHCAKGFLLLRHMKLAQTVMDGSCENLPEIDSSELCARISPPGNNYKNLLCKKRFQFRALQPSSPVNIVEKIPNANAICENVRWRSINQQAQSLLSSVFTNTTAVPSGRFAQSSGNFFCFHVPLKLSDVVRNRNQYSKMIGLPLLSKKSLDSTIQGFSVKLEDGLVKQLIIPIGYTREYHLDKKLMIPNVTLYYYSEPSMAKIFGEGVLDLCGTEFKIQIEQIKPDVTLLSGRSPHPVDLSTVELAFGLRQPSSDVISVMKQFQILKLRLTNPKLNILWDGDNGRTMRFSGRSYYNGWGSVEVDVEFLLGKDRSFWAAAVSTYKRSFKEIFGILTGMKHVRLAKLLDMSLDVTKVGFILATKGVKVPKHSSLKFQYEPVAGMSTLAISNGFSLEAHANVKDSCKRNDNRSFICQLVQFATGIKATTRIRIKSDLKGLRLVLKFYPDGQIPDYSMKFLSKVRNTWNKIDPFSRIPGSNVEITENADPSWRLQPRYHGIVWLRQLEIYVKFEERDEIFERNIVYITGDVVILNKRYNYKINNVGLSYCLRLLDSITETLKHCQSDL